MYIRFNCDVKYWLKTIPKIRVVVFDLDGTLTKISSIWRFIHENFGVWDRAKRHKDMFFRGEISYEEWAILDAELWKGKSIEDFMKIVDDIPLMDDVDVVLNELSKYYKIVILTSGLDILARKFSGFNIYEFVGNRLIFRDNIFSGDVEVKVKFDNKPEILEPILSKLGYGFENVASIGDGENDIELFKKSALAIAFNPKSEKVEKASHIVVKASTLKPIIEILLK